MGTACGLASACNASVGDAEEEIGRAQKNTPKVSIAIITERNESLARDSSATERSLETMALRPAVSTPRSGQIYRGPWPKGQPSRSAHRLALPTWLSTCQDGAACLFLQGSYVAHREIA